MTQRDDTSVTDPTFGAMPLNWKWMLGLGIVMAVLGVIGLGMTYALTFISVLWFGVLAVIAGVVQVIDAFKYSGWKSVVWHVLLGLLYIVAGVVLIVMPVQSAWWLTLLIGAAFLVSGVLRIIMAFQMKATGAALWLGLSGLISLALGVMIYAIIDFPEAEQLATPETALAWFQEWGWIIGLFVAIELIVHGVSLIALSLAARERGSDAAAHDSQANASA